MTTFSAINITKRLLTGAALLTGLLLIDGQLGSLTFALRRVTAAALATVVVAALLRPKFTAKYAASLVALVATAIAPTVGLAALPYIFALTLLVDHGDSSESSAPLGLPAAGLTYLGVGFCADLFPPSRAVGEFVCDAARSYLRVATGAEHRLGPTALGASAAALAVLYLLWQWRLRGSSVRLIAATLLTPVWFAMLPICLPAPPADSQDVFLRAACSGLACIAIAAAIDAAAPLKTPRAASTGGRMPQTAAIALGGLGVLVGLTLVATVHPTAPANQSMLVHNRGGLDWERPVFGKFGAFSGGMFGLLPVYARGNGYRFEVLDNDTIHAADLKGFQTLVLINSPKRWAGEELRAVREFVANGGGLLVLGDHTDVFGLMTGFNSLLEPFGIAFQFDSAYFARSTWRGCLACAPDVVTYGWENEGPGRCPRLARGSLTFAVYRGDLSAASDFVPHGRRGRPSGAKSGKMSAGNARYRLLVARNGASSRRVAEPPSAVRRSPKATRRQPHPQAGTRAVPHGLIFGRVRYKQPTRISRPASVASNFHAATWGKAQSWRPLGVQRAVGNNSPDFSSALAWAAH